MNYVDQNTAQAGGLVQTTNGAVYMGVDYTNVATSAGRTSVRLTSKKSYTHGLIILDLEHMPGGVCGTWPAFWTVGPNWPDSGEIDIIEGVNSQVANSMALHTGPGCSITNNGGFTGSITTPNCDVNAGGQATNAGCQILTSNSASYGTGFNQQQGGVYATEWTSSAISVWFFPRSAIPSDIAAGTPDPSNWGVPTSSFAGGCDIDQFFTNHQIVFDTTFCGDWAGNVWSSDATCGSQAPTCQSFVQNNPSAFADAYWTVNSLKVYQSDGEASASTPGVPHGPTASIPAGVPAASGVSGVPGVPGVPGAPAPAPSYPPTGGYSRGGNGRFTKTWAVGANFVAAVTSTEVVTLSPTPLAAPAPAADTPAAAAPVQANVAVEQVAAPAAAPAASSPAAAASSPAAVQIESNGAVGQVAAFAASSPVAAASPPATVTSPPEPQVEAAVAPAVTAEPVAETPAPDSNSDAQPMTVSALSYDDFPKDKKRDAPVDVPFSQARAERRDALDNDMPSHRHAHMHRHLIKHGVAAGLLEGPWNPS